MATDFSNSGWTWKDWTKAIVAGVGSWFAVSYIIQPALSRGSLGTAALLEWISAKSAAKIILCAKGGLERIVFELAGILSGVLLAVIAFIVFGYLSSLIRFLWKKWSQTSEPSWFSSFRGFFSKKRRKGISLIMTLILIFLLFVVVHDSVMLALGMSMRRQFKNAMARLAPHIPQEQIIEFQSRWWGMRGWEDYSSLAKDVNKLAIDKNVFIGNPMSEGYVAIVDPTAKNK